MYTGECILPGGKFNVTFQQSLYAYAFVRELARGRTVLDVGSGEGYGCAYLADVAREVVGIDNTPAAVLDAMNKYRAPNVSFVNADLFHASARLGGRTFDIVSSFQTIEHVRDHDAFMRALRRLTAPGGKVIVTTPNKRMFPTFNPYHVHEVDAHELRDLFRRHFPRSELYGVFGDEPVLRYRAGKQKIGNMMLALDPFRVRERLPAAIIHQVYAGVSLVIKSISYAQKKRDVEKITLHNFSHSAENLDQALDFIAVGTTAGS